MKSMKTMQQHFLYDYEAPKRPLIRKLGTIACDTVETTPVVFRGRLYRFESVRPASQNEANPDERPYLRFVDVQTNAVSTAFGFGHCLASAYADGDTMYAVGVRGGWGKDTLTVFRSADLETWEEYPVTFPGFQCFNTGICKKDGIYTMLIEVSDAVPFTFRFAQSEDLLHWTLLPEPYVFQKDRYAGGPAIYTLENDPHYYVLYLEAYPGFCYATCIARSADLKNWEYSPINPVLMFNEAEDKQIANPFLSTHEQARIERALDINNSDMELCECNGRTVICYSWGCQRGIEFLAEAVYEGPMRELLRGFFHNDD